jgi:hypothetical protein
MAKVEGSNPFIRFDQTPAIVHYGLAPVSIIRS